MLRKDAAELSECLVVSVQQDCSAKQWTGVANIDCRERCEPLHLAPRCERRGVCQIEYLQDGQGKGEPAYALKIVGLDRGFHSRRAASSADTYPVCYAVGRTPRHKRSTTVFASQRPSKTPVAQDQSRRLARAACATLEVIARYILNPKMRRIRKGHGRNLMPGQLNCRAEAGPVYLSEIVDMLRHPALPQTEIAAKLFDGTMIGPGQPPDPAREKLVGYRRRSARQWVHGHPNSAMGWRGMFQACFAHTGRQA